MLGGLGGGGLVIGSVVIGGLVIGVLSIGVLSIGVLVIGGLCVAAGEENTPEPEESKDSPNSGVTSKGILRGPAGVEPGKRAFG